MTTLRGLLFDKDGTLFEFSASWMSVVDRTLDVLSRNTDEREHMAEAVGYEIRERNFVPGSLIVAGTVDQFAAVWAEFRPDLGSDQIELIANQIVDDAVSQGALTPAVPDLRALLTELKTQGFVLGIATHDSEAAARSHVASYDALECFDFIAGYDSGVGHKPGPGMMHAFCAATGLKPSECAMIGDSIHDLGVAPSSGAAMAIGVLTGPARHDDLAPLADHVIASIGELPQLLKTLGRPS